MKKKPTREQAENAVRTLLEYIGENPEREGLIQTPKRVVQSYNEFFSGYKQNPEKILDSTFEDVEQYDEIILLKHIRVESYCEHHMVPILGIAHVAYIPNKKIVGISKISRLLDIFSKRLQTQERLTTQISLTIQKNLNPKGVAVIINASHNCMTTRGVHKTGASMTTNSMLGVFKQQDIRSKLLSLIG